MGSLRRRTLHLQRKPEMSKALSVATHPFLPVSRGFQPGGTSRPRRALGPFADLLASNRRRRAVGSAALTVSQGFLPPRSTDSPWTHGYNGIQTACCLSGWLSDKVCPAMEFAWPRPRRTAFRLMTPTEKTLYVTVASHANDDCNQTTGASPSFRGPRKGSCAAPATPRETQARPDSRSCGRGQVRAPGSSARATAVAFVPALGALGGNL